ncbi:hypothetical protein QTL95_09275 [Rhizobium sp. S152]|nr:hypothetical protein [Rhizobium sp. S152]MDM9626087.1 hypothetical protein [Rhizobium sp. S152]
MQLNYADGLSPFFAAAGVVSRSGGSKTVKFHDGGETWLAKLYYQDSGIVNPGPRLPTGTRWEFDTMREYRIAILRNPDEDAVGEQKMNAHLRPRWQGMQVEKDDGSRFRLNIPRGITEGVNVRLNGSNIDIWRYQTLLREAAAALGINPDHFVDPHESSTVQDGERYVRVHTDASGPIHARDGPIAEMGHLLEHDREGYRKVVQNDADEDGRALPGYYHTVTLGPKRVREAFPSHSLPTEVKHYYAREALSMPKDNPLRHPKLGVSYQVSRWDESLGVAPEDLEQIERELDRTVHAVLIEAGIDPSPTHGSGPYIEDAYFDAETREGFEEPPALDLTHIRQEQESVVVRNLTDGLSPVEWESLQTLVTDGGSVSPADIADEHGRHVGSVRRALNRIDEMVEREYGTVSLKSSFVAELVHDAVKEARDANRRVVDAAGKALAAAERGLDETTSALLTWCSKHDIDVDSRGEAIERIRMGEVERGPVGTDANGSRYPIVSRKLRKALDLWTDAGRDPGKFRSATVEFSLSGSRGVRRVPAFEVLR